jgi:hypothetical protein
MPMVGRGLHPMLLFMMFLCPLRKMQGFMSFENKPHSFVTFSLDFLLVVDIVLLVDDIIINPIRIDLVSWVILFCKVPMITAIQMKEGLYCNCYIMDMFFLLP